MKKLLVSIAALSVVIPSVASAATAGQSLSVKSAAVEPVRASAKAGETKAVGKVPLIIAAIVVAGGLIWLIADGQSN